MTTKNNKRSLATNSGNAKVAGAGILGAVALSSDKNRKAIKNKFNDLKKQGQKVLNDLQDKAEKLTTTGKEKLGEKVKELKSSASAIKKDIKAKL